jgi:hypothetical protein
MSKVSEAKKAQNYMKEKGRPNCGNCNNFTCDEEKNKWTGGVIQRNQRCAVGGFAVQKKSCCDMHESIA